MIEMAQKPLSAMFVSGAKHLLLLRRCSQEACLPSSGQGKNELATVIHVL